MTSLWWIRIEVGSINALKPAKLEYFGLSECKRVKYRQVHTAKLVLLSQEDTLEAVQVPFSAVFSGSKQVNSQNGTGCYSSHLIEVIASESIQSNNDIMKI